MEARARGGGRRSTYRVIRRRTYAPSGRYAYSYGGGYTHVYVGGYGHHGYYYGGPAVHGGGGGGLGALCACCCFSLSFCAIVGAAIASERLERGRYEVYSDDSGEVVVETRYEVRGGSSGTNAPPPAGPPSAMCPDKHPMHWLNKNPYPGAEAVTCDICNKDIPEHYWFHHCYTCDSDICMECGVE